ncbi:MAG TPA: IS1634 family transposase [Thermotogota bacterium]|nr:IS1634 family transposase [Thermotogota bacterium]
MHLGSFDLPKERWKELATCLERKLSGQSTFQGEAVDIEQIASRIMEQYRQFSRKKEEKQERQEHQQIVPVDTQSIVTTYTRSLGGEMVAHHAWKALGMDTILKKAGMSARECALAEATVVCRLLDPGSEVSAWEWLTRRTALNELMDVNLEKIGKDGLYDIGDSLYGHKEYIESALYEEEHRQYGQGPMVYLYDLTNTFLEGQGKKNALAARGKSKEKRSDCPLIALALVVDQRGFPVYSQIYPGNQSEPITLQAVLTRLEESLPPLLKQEKPMMVMDRGIATGENLRLMEEKGYAYTVVERREREKDYPLEWEEGFTLIGEEADGVYVKRVEEEGKARVLCASVGRKEKEQGMDRLQEKRFLEALERLSGRIRMKRLKKMEKVWERVGRIRERYPSIAQYYTVTTETSPDGKEVQSLRWEVRKDEREQREKLTGCYVLESTRTDLSAAEIWKLYMTIQRVESAFRCLKSELGLRPIYHQKTERTKAHLFISIVAYHLLNWIEQRLKEAGDHRQWSTIRKTLSTHQRCTVIFRDEEDKVYHLRVSGKPESLHEDIYRKLGVPMLKNRQLTYVAHRL